MKENAVPKQPPLEEANYELVSMGEDYELANAREEDDDEDDHQATSSERLTEQEDTSPQPRTCAVSLLIFTLFVGVFDIFTDGLFIGSTVARAHRHFSNLNCTSTFLGPTQTKVGEECGFFVGNISTFPTVSELNDTIGTWNRTLGRVLIAGWLTFGLSVVLFINHVRILWKRRTRAADEPRFASKRGSHIKSKLLIHLIEDIPQSVLLGVFFIATSGDLNTSLNCAACACTQTNINGDLCTEADVKLSVTAQPIAFVSLLASFIAPFITGFSTSYFDSLFRLRSIFTSSIASGALCSAACNIFVWILLFAFVNTDNTYYFLGGAFALLVTLSQVACTCFLCKQFFSQRNNRHHRANE